MRVLIIGSGGREHALAWKLKQSPLCDELFIAPGNGGTTDFCENLSFPIDDHAQVAKTLKNFSIDMLVIGPEVPLVEGLVDYLAQDSELNSLMIIGPHKNGAMLEGSKSYAKQFMLRHGIPTADYFEVNLDNLENGIEKINGMNPPIVLKADGLAAGKGVLICKDHNEASEKLEILLRGKFGKASEKVIVEEFLDGIEFSVFALTDGQSYVILPEAKDYKRIGEGDTGLNTGGMGAISPVPFFSDELKQVVIDSVVDPTVKGIQKDNLKYTGIIYFGLILVDGNPYVIEYNCRFGDPETEAILPRIKTDLIQLFSSACDGTLSSMQIEFEKKHSATIVMASGGYPEKYDKGYEIKGLDEINDSVIFHAGTTSDGSILTNGGRVLMVTSLGGTLEEALHKSYQSADNIHFTSKYFRRDLGHEFL